MFFENVISYRGAWENITKNHPTELEEISRCLPIFIREIRRQKRKQKKERLTSREIWEELLKEEGWGIIEREVYSDIGKKIRIDSLGPVKNGICASIPLSYLEFFNRWFYVHTIVAAKYGIIGIPILLIPISDYTGIADKEWLKRTSFESIRDQLMALMPINHPIPFLIIGFTEQLSFHETNVIKLDADPLTKPNNRIFEWETKLEKHLQQIGVEILSFFSTYLNEQYPDENTSISVKQAGFKVKLVVESLDKQPYIIERAFGEYHSILTGKNDLNEFVKNEKLKIQLQTQLEMAQVKINMLEKLYDERGVRLDRVLDLLEHSISNKNIIKIENTNTIENTNNISINQNISGLIDHINELAELTSKHSEEYLKLIDLVKSLESIRNENDHNVIRNSSALKKIRNFIEQAKNKASKIGRLVNSAEIGWHTIKKIISAYNAIAKLCGFDELPLNV